MIPYQSIERVERIDSPLSLDMVNALQKWYDMYIDEAPWVNNDTVFSMNLSSFIAGEIARQILLEVKWDISGKAAPAPESQLQQSADEAGESLQTGTPGRQQPEAVRPVPPDVAIPEPEELGETENGETMNPRAQYLKDEFSKLMNSKTFREKLEQACAAGGMIIKPYPDTETGHMHFDWAMDWGFYPIAFDDDGNLTDFIIPDILREGKFIYTRLERHTVIRNEDYEQSEPAEEQTPAPQTEKPENPEEEPTVQKAAEGTQGEEPTEPTKEPEEPRTEPQEQPQTPRRSGYSVRITQRAFQSTFEDALGREINLEDVPRWAHLQPEAIVTETEAPLIGWFKVAAANTVDVDSPLGASVYSRSVRTIEQADKQYSRVLWEYEGTELAVDVDPSALRPRKVAGGGFETPKLNKRLFRAVDIDKGDRDLYEVFSPQIRDASLFQGLNRLLMIIEDQCGLSRGTLSDANLEPRTATELRIVRTRTYQTIADNQRALENCLKDVVAAMDRYATLYNLAPEGDYDISFEWDDSILTDGETQTQERMMLMNAGVISKSEMRMWYLGETKAQAEAAIAAVREESASAMLDMQEMLPAISDNMGRGYDGNPAGSPQEPEEEPEQEEENSTPPFPEKGQ